MKNTQNEEENKKREKEKEFEREKIWCDDCDGKLDEDAPSLRILNFAFILFLR